MEVSARSVAGAASTAELREPWRLPRVYEDAPIEVPHLLERLAELWEAEAADVALCADLEPDTEHPAYRAALARMDARTGSGGAFYRLSQRLHMAYGGVAPKALIDGVCAYGALVLAEAGVEDGRPPCAR